VSLIIKKYNDLSAIHFFYGDTERLRFSPSKWLWVREVEGKLQELAGVTGVVKIIDKSAALMPWAVRKAMEKLRRLLVEGHLGPDDCIQVFEAELDAIIAEAKKADREELESAGETGHDAHSWIEELIKSNLSDNRNRELEVLAKLPTDERAASCCIGAVEWMVAHNVRWRSTERKVFHREHLYAGTMDGLCIVDSCSDRLCCPSEFKDRLTISDWKTSNYLYVTYLMQVAAYQAAYECETGEQVEDRWVLRLDKETGDFDPWHAEGREAFTQDFDAFLQALALTRSLKAIDGRIGVIRDARREVRKAAAEAARAERLALACEGSKKYKGIRVPKCGPTGTGCLSCLKKYFEVHPEKP
jgi:hypothetical protein